MAQTQFVGSSGAGVNAGVLQRVVSGLCGIADRRAELTDEAKVFYGEARDAGLNTPMLRQMVKERRMEEDARVQLYSLQRDYRAELGLFADTPLGGVTVEREEREDSARRADAMQRELNGSGAIPKPKPFAEKPITPPRRGRRRQAADAGVDDALARARTHLGSSGSA